jgi:hypothetical protein
MASWVDYSENGVAVNGCYFVVLVFEVLAFPAEAFVPQLDLAKGVLPLDKVLPLEREVLAHVDLHLERIVHLIRQETVLDVGEEHLEVRFQVYRPTRTGCDFLTRRHHDTQQGVL